MYVEEMNNEFTVENLEKGVRKMKYYKNPGDEAVQTGNWGAFSNQRVEKFV
jgi:hypothetical protein